MNLKELIICITSYKVCLLFALSLVIVRCIYPNAIVKFTINKSTIIKRELL